MTPSFEENSPLNRTKFCHKKLWSLNSPKNFVILACTVWIGINGVTDGQTDASAIAKTHEALHERLEKTK